MPFTLEAAATKILAILTEHVPGGRARELPTYQTNVSNNLHKAFLGVRDRWIVTLESNDSGGIRATMRDVGDNRDRVLGFDAADESELVTNMAGWFPKIEWWRGRLSVYRLVPGTVYRVRQTFKDYYGNVFMPNARLTYVGQNFLPYDGGYTVSFKEATMYLQETESAEILDNLDAYLETADDELSPASRP